MAIRTSRLTKRLTLASLAIGVVFTASACSSSGDAGSTDGSGDQVTVGYSGYTVDIGYFVGLEKGMQQGADAAGVKLISTNANSDSSQQLTDIQNLITQGIDYLVVSPYDGAAVIPGVKAAEEAGIPVISVADDIKTDIAMTMNLDHVDAGRQEAANLLEFLTAKNGAPKGTVVDIQGTPATVSTGLRGQGLQELVAEYPDIRIVQSVNGEWTTEGANKAMTDVLQAQPDIDAVYTDSGDMSVGAIRAIEVAGLLKPVGDPDHIWVGGINGDPNAIAYIRENMQDVEVASNPVKMGALLMDMLKDAKLNGTELPKNYEFKNLAITPANIDSPEVEEYGIWADEIK